MHVWWAERSGLLNISLPALSPRHCTANKMETLKKISALWQARVMSPESGCQFSISRNPQCLHLPLRVWKQLCDDVRPKAKQSLQNWEVCWRVWPGGWKLVFGSVKNLILMIFKGILELETKCYTMRYIFIQKNKRDSSSKNVNFVIINVIKDAHQGCLFD